MSLPQPAEHPPGRLAQLRRLPAGALTFWRRSLRTRVVTAIVVLCAVVVGSVGWLVMRQISDGLVKSRVDASVAEARTETATARERLGSAGGNDFDPDTQLRLLVENLVARGEVKGFEVVVRGPVDEGSATGGVRTTPGRGRRAASRQRCASPSRAAGTAWPGPTPGSRYTRRRATRPAAPGPARRRGRVHGRAALRRRQLRALLPVPDGGGAADARCCCAGCC